MDIPEQMKLASKNVTENGPVPTTVREILHWYKYARRGSWINKIISMHLTECKIQTSPDFEKVWIDRPIELMPLARKPEASTETTTTKETEQQGVSASHMISRLAAANNRPTSIKPNESVNSAITMMMMHDYSQLPVMKSVAQVVGIISWKSIGERFSMNQGNLETNVDQCMHKAVVVRDDESMFDAMALVAKHDSVLVREGNGQICGIITAADISEQFRNLSEPFIHLSDIENNLRRIIETTFDGADLEKLKDPEDEERQIESVADLTFGEYLRILENPEHWSKIGLPIDRAIFVKKLDRIRVIRNAVMHFDPDGIDNEQLDELSQFSKFTRLLADSRP